MKQSILFLFFFIPFSFQVKAQFENNYFPIEFTGEIPEDFRTDKISEAIVQVTKSTSSLKKKERKKFYISSLYSVDDLYKSGRVYFNDEISNYIKEVAKEILSEENQLDKKAKIWVTKFNSPNAITFQDGSIFVNIGLLAWLENEAQLAYVLSHELAHYTEDHVLKQHEFNVELRKNSFQISKSEDYIVNELSYSREQENMADEIGLERFLLSNYNPSESVSALKILKLVDFDRYAKEPISYANFLSKINIDYKEDFFLKCEKHLENNIELDTSSELTSSNKSKLSIEDSYDENLSTHPSLESRIENISSKVPVNSSKNSLFLVSKEKFERTKTIALFEMINEYFQSSQYAMCIYESIQLLNKYPNNEFLHVMIARSFYWLGYYKSIDNLENIFRFNVNLPQCSFKNFLCNLSNFEQYEKIALAFINYSLNKYPNSEILSIYKALGLELNKDYKEAKSQYINYINQHPKGRYKAYANAQKSKLR